MHNLNEKSLTSDQALKRLMAGNERFVKSKPRHPHQTTKRRIDLKKGQNPFAVILGCSDSRVPPEVIFDQGLGDLFVVRVAGNIEDEIVLGSIEYAASYLHTPLIVVLGHSQCGAITAALSGSDLDGHLPSLAAAIQPALDRITGQPSGLINKAAKVNAKAVSERLKNSSNILSDLLHRSALKIVPAFYDLDSGIVELID